MNIILTFLFFSKDLKWLNGTTELCPAWMTVVYVSTLTVSLPTKQIIRMFLSFIIIWLSTSREIHIALKSFIEFDSTAIRH